MFIIWGSTSKKKRVAEGEFYCPRCRDVTDYDHRRVQQYFTLYFIPLFPTNSLGEYVECRHCGGTFDPAILELSARQVEELLQPWTCLNCRNLNPPSESSCPRCQCPRPAPDFLPHPAPAEDDDEVAKESSDTAKLLQTKRNKTFNSEHWKQRGGSGRCKECGVVDTNPGLHCRACGSRLDLQ